MNPQKPPQWADRLLTWLCRPDRLEDVQGDLYEAFYWRVEERGVRQARIQFVFEVLLSLRPPQLKPFQFMNTLLITLFSHLKMGRRFLWKTKEYSLLNLFGLGLGLAISWMAYLYVFHQSSYNRHLPDSERLHRLTASMKWGDQVYNFSGASHAMALAFEAIPEVEAVAKFDNGLALIRQEDKVFTEDYLMADKNLVKMLDLKLSSGTVGAFDDPKQAILSESMAHKIFGRSDIVGEVLNLKEGDHFVGYRITGVFEDIPENTSVNADIFIPYEKYLLDVSEQRKTEWMDINMSVILKLNKERTVAEVVDKINAISKERDEENAVTLDLQALNEMHLGELRGSNGFAQVGNPWLVKVILTVGLICLVIAIINYTNFNVALYLTRSKEVGIRKVMGTNRWGIFGQLIAEATLSTFFSAIIGLAILLWLMPGFASIIDFQFSWDFLLSPQIVLGTVGLLLMVILMCGSYPALVLSKTKITEGLKGKTAIGSKRWITKGLLTFQFAISSLLIMGMIVLRSQVGHFSSFDKGFSDENVLVIDQLYGQDEDKLNLFLNELEQQSNIENVAVATGYNATMIDEEDVKLDVLHVRVNEAYTDALKIEVIEGRFFDDKFPGDKMHSVVVNEALVQALGMNDPIGKMLPFKYKELQNPRIVGVLKNDYRFSPKNEPRPTVYYTSPQYEYQDVFIKYKNDDSIDLENLESIWKSVYYPYPIEAKFLSNEYEAAYETETNMMRVALIGSVIAIILGVIGLLGLLGIRLQMQLKEINIRKVLGCTASQLFILLSQRFTYLIITGTLVGLVGAYFLLQNWLENYANRIELHWQLFLLTGMVMLLFTGLMLWLRTFPVIRANPVKFLRDE